jgi:hypothetical protein
MNNKKAVGKMSKLIVGVQLIFLTGVVFFLYVFAPRMDYPFDGALLEQNGVEFRFRNANFILIDDNPDFSSPMKISSSEIEGKKLVFEEGTYYWKAEGILSGVSKEFTINSNVGLELVEENSSLKNVGTVQLNVSKENSDGSEGVVILDVEIEYPVNMSDEVVYRGEQNG